MLLGTPFPIQSSGKWQHIRRTTFVLVEWEAYLYVSRVIVKNHRCLKAADVTLNPDLNVFVGSNECGKSTLLEAIYLALSGQLNRRPIKAELQPLLFNAEAVAGYIAAPGTKTAVVPPRF